jgi:hypothetical protein
MTTKTDKILAKIAKLDSKLVQIARKAARKSINLSEAEMYQIIYVGLLERAQYDPEFFEQTDSHIVKGALWIGTHAASKDRTYFMFTDGEMNTIDPETEEDDGDLDLAVSRETRTSIAQAIAQVEVSVMIRQLSEQMLDAYELLSEDNQTLVKMMILGYKQTEIAEYLGIGKSAVSQRLGTIAKVFQPFVQGF